MSATTDLTAFALVLRTPDGGWRVRPHFWIPADRMAHRERRDRVPYQQWADAGLITTCPGKAIRQSMVEAYIAEQAKRYNLAYIGYDKWNCSELANRLEEHHGMKMVAVGQGYANLTAPCKEFEAAVIQHRLDHGANPVMDWMADNVEVQSDPAGNLRYVKPQPGGRQRIDGIAAAVMGMAVAMQAPQKRRSVYEDRGFLEIGG